MTLDGPILVVGCGLIGTSVALALSEQGLQVHLADRDAGNVELAVARGAGSAVPIEDPRVVVVAVPPSAATDVAIASLQAYPGAVVTDVVSVKADLVHAVERRALGERFVGGHPMAGKERSGPMAAAARLFEGRPWAVVPTATSEPDAIAAVTALAETVGAVPRTMDAATHDRAVAFVSHVPHLAAVLVAGLLHDAPDGALELAGPGLRDVTRIAASETGLWIDILNGNGSEVSTLLRRLGEAVDDALASVVDRDADKLAALLDAGRAGTRLVPGRHGGQSESLAVVYVSVSDEPGVLSRLMTDTGESDVNIEDFRIDHELGRLVGQAEISVLETRADHLVESLNRRGWTAHR